jgi:hypothetical protein
MILDDYEEIDDIFNQQYHYMDGIADSIAGLYSKYFFSGELTLDKFKDEIDEYIELKITLLALDGRKNFDRTVGSSYCLTKSAGTLYTALYKEMLLKLWNDTPGNMVTNTTQSWQELLNRKYARHLCDMVVRYFYYERALEMKHMIIEIDINAEDRMEKLEDALRFGGVGPRFKEQIGLSVAKESGDLVDFCEVLGRIGQRIDEFRHQL